MSAAPFFTDGQLDLGLCQHSDTTEPFEMDGFDDAGVWRAEGLWWACCRDCGRTFLVGVQTEMEVC